MKASELRKLDDAELNDQIREYHEELFNLRFQAVTGRLTNTARARQVKKDIARIKTVLRQRALEHDALG